MQGEDGGVSTRYKGKWRTVFLYTANGLGQRALIRNQVLNVEPSLSALVDNLCLGTDVSEAVIQGMLRHV